MSTAARQTKIAPLARSNFAPSFRGTLQRKCDCGGNSGSKSECEECKKKRGTGMLQRAQSAVGSNGAQANLAPPIVHEVLRSPGQPLDSKTRAFMEPRFGHDFGNVRVHTDAKAAESARAMNALAYTVDNRIAFGFGQHAPHTESGRRLIAHELAHTIQQSGTIPTSQNLTVDKSGSSAERAAERVAAEVSGGASVDATALRQSSRAILQRACGPIAIGAPSACTGVNGDIVGERFRFVVNCDDLLPREQKRLQAFAATIATGETIEIHGFASIDGDSAFNDNLSCARAIKTQLILQGAISALGVSATITLFNHGATPGGDVAEQRSVVVTRSGITPVVPSSPCIPPTNADQSGSAFNPTTSSQNAVIARHAIDAFTVKSLASDALALAASSGLPGLHLGPADSLRHCFWSCRMAQKFGAGEAEQFATAHENSGPSAIPFDNQMDLHDNSIGRGLGAPGADCEAQCRSAVASGLLRSLRGPAADASALAEGLSSSSPPVSTTCIGASNQPWP